ncbi:hypothetical protein HRbin26_00666 [bacterium HR26]|nr:hypothetical protein HRbin26_00666 [bacterium HR26]
MDETRSLEAILQLNLSYVLHEPSMSPAVGALARQVLANRRRIETATRRLSSLDDLALLTRVVPRDHRRLWALQARPPDILLTVRLGAWPLLERVIGLHLGQQRPLAELHLLDEVSADRGWSLPLFRATARVALPPEGRLAGRHACFATLVFRPGWQTLLLDLTPLAGDPAEERETWVASLASAIEAAIREFTDQWLCARALWEAPAERALPEFVADGS